MGPELQKYQLNFSQSDDWFEIQYVSTNWWLIRAKSIEQYLIDNSFQRIRLKSI